MSANTVARQYRLAHQNAKDIEWRDRAVAIETLAIALYGEAPSGDRTATCWCALPIDERDQWRVHAWAIWTGVGD